MRMGISHFRMIASRAVPRYRSPACRDGNSIFLN